MSKALTRLTLALLLAALCARAAAAQTTLEWIVLSPAGEGFTARVPKQPASVEQSVRTGGLDASVMPSPWTRPAAEAVRRP